MAEENTEWMKLPPDEKCVHKVNHLGTKPFGLYTWFVSPTAICISGSNTLDLFLFCILEVLVEFVEDVLRFLFIIL